MKKLIVFDLDGTLAESKSPVDAEMADRLGALLAAARVAVISGGDWPQFEKQLLARLRRGESLERLFLLPACGTKLYRYESGWRKVYSDDLSRGEKDKIVRSIERARLLTGLETGRTWGDPIEDRGSQITFSALGQEAPIEEKKKWDPDFRKRRALKAVLDGLLPHFSVRLGGSTSVDVTKAGIDKAFGLAKLRELLGVELREILFVGDALFPGGNDYPVQEAGATCVQVEGPEESKGMIEALAADAG